MRAVAGFFVATLVLVALLAVRLYVQNAELHGPAGGAGTIEGESVIVSSRLAARVLTVEVKEGQQLEAGAVVATLDCSEPQATLAEAEARLLVAQAQAQAQAAQAAATRKAGQASKQASRAAAAQAEMLALQKTQASRSADRLDALGQDVALDRRESARTQAQGLEQQAAGAQASRDASMAQAAAAGEQTRAAEASAMASEENIKAALAAVDRAKIMVGECVIKAPAPGYVETLPWHPGELVTVGGIVARLVDIREVKATFYLPNAEVSAVKAGAAAEVMADAYGEEVFKGTVSTVTLTAEFTPRNIQTRSDRDRLVYPVEVVIPNPDGRLRPGMPVQVTLPGTER